MRLIRAVRCSRYPAARTVHDQARLLFDAFDGHKTHVGAGDGFCDGCGIGGGILAALAARAVRGEELGGHQADGVAILAKLAGPMVGA